jgi:KEOPS complex subunit Pcc1
VKAKAVVRLPLNSEEHLAALVNALTPEVQRQIWVRSKVALSTGAQILVLTVDAEDTVALRAALNSYLRWINSTLKVLQAVTQKS